MQDTILAISGRQGLYKLVSQGRGMIIVETIDESHKRFSVGARERVTSLNDISMYTNEEDKPLMDIFQTICDKENAQETSINYKKATSVDLAAFMVSVLPEYDKDRVHDSDIRKLIQWYNILTKGGYTKFVEAKKQPNQQDEKVENNDNKE